MTMSRSPARRRAARASIGLLLLATASVLGAVCEAPTGSEPSNRVPETYLSISDADVDTTFYVLDLSWWGEDSDGRIDRYEFRWDGLWQPGPGDTLTSDSPPWVETRDTRRVFVMPVMGTVTSPVFHVRAVDDDGAADPTPVVQTFTVANRLAHVAFGGDLSRPSRSLPGVTFSLTASDPDGPATIVGYRYWFEGQDPETEATFVPGTTAAHITLGPSDFPGAGTQTVHFQAIDETASASADTASHTWEIIDTTGKRLLVVDHYPNSFQFGTEVDAFYRDAAARAFGDAFVDLSIGTDGAFQTEEEVSLAFSAFESVLWYCGLQPSNETNSIQRRDELRTASSGMLAFVEQGGQAIIQSQFAFGDLLANETDIEFHAGFDSVEAYDFLGIEWPYDFASSIYNTNFSIFPGREFTAAPEWASAPLKLQSPTLFQELSPLPPDGDPIAWFPPGSVTIGFDGQGQPILNPTNYYTAYRVERGAGTFIAILLPLSRSNGNGSAPEVLDRALSEFAAHTPRFRRPLALR